MSDIKDGVTLIADAIRKEKEELAKQNNITTSNVIDVTAQFKNGGKTAPVDMSDKKDTSSDVNTSIDEPDGTYPDGVPDDRAKAINNG